MNSSVDPSAAKREPDNVTPCWACNGSGTQVIGDELETEVFECAVCNGTGLPASDLTPEQIEMDRQATALDDADDHFVIGQTSAGWPDTDLAPATGDVLTHHADHAASRTRCGIDLAAFPMLVEDPSALTCAVCAGKVVDEQLAEPALVEPDRRTVSLEVLTPELCRPNPVPADTRVGVVLRLNGEPVSIVSAYDPAHDGSPAEVLYKLLRVAHDAAQSAIDPDLGGELLMPTPDVLAALDGRPDAQLLTAPVWVLALDIEPGMLLAPVALDDLRRVTGPPTECTKPGCTEGASCVVLAFDGGEQHQSGYARTRVRIPCAVTR